MPSYGGLKCITFLGRDKVLEDMNLTGGAFMEDMALADGAIVFPGSHLLGRCHGERVVGTRVVF